MKRSVPNSPSLISRVDLIVGIRDAQLEKHSPERKNSVLMTILCLVFESIFFPMGTDMYLIEATKIDIFCYDIDILFSI